MNLSDDREEFDEVEQTNVLKVDWNNDEKQVDEKKWNDEKILTFSMIDEKDLWFSNRLRQNREDFSIECFLEQMAMHLFELKDTKRDHIDQQMRLKNSKL